MPMLTAPARDTSSTSRPALRRRATLSTRSISAIDRQRGAVPGHHVGAQLDDDPVRVGEGTAVHVRLVLP
jgi:hypothetical protein